MIVINNSLAILEKIIGKQENKNLDYRHFKYLEWTKCDDGFLLYNTLTKELLFLDSDEFNAFKEIDKSNNVIEYLISGWYLVPQENDDYSLFKETNSVIKLVYNSSATTINNFVIFPTTDCNARCFYCFENGSKKHSMKAETALDVADFIIKKSNHSKKVTLNWFGGEPTLNTKAIELICEKLKKADILFESKMISNGYLFDEKMIDNALKIWNLKSIQITLDGTEEEYNRIKNYIYKQDESPFKRVLNNIKLLSKAGIYVSIRLNMDLNNCQNIKELAVFLTEELKDYNNLSVYVRILYEKTAKISNPRSIEDKKILHEKFLEIKKILETNRKYNAATIKKYENINSCMADDNSATTILPDGSLGKCEHYTDTKFYGNIYSDKIDYNIINYFKETSDYGEQCKNCNLLIKCWHLTNCPINTNICDEYDKEMRIESLKMEMISTYNNFKKENYSTQLEFDDEH